MHTLAARKHTPTTKKSMLEERLQEEYAEVKKKHGERHFIEDHHASIAFLAIIAVSILFLALSTQVSITGNTVQEHIEAPQLPYESQEPVQPEISVNETNTSINTHI